MWSNIININENYDYYVATLNVRTVSNLRSLAKIIKERFRFSTCTPEGHHPNRHEVDDVRLPGGELGQPHIEHADKDQRAQS